VQTLYRTEILAMDGGERFPLLIDNATGVPDPTAIRFSLANHRVKSPAYGRAQLEAIGRFYEWADDAGIDLDQQFGTCNLFSADEVDSLADWLRWSKRTTIEINGETVAAPNIGDTHGNRIGVVAAFIKWRAQHVIQAMPLTDPRVEPANDRLKAILEQLEARKTSGGARSRLGLTIEQQIRLLEITRPDSPLNPFTPKTRHRNFALILLYLDLGVRKSEPLVLKARHLHLIGKDPHIRIAPNPNDPDEVRADPPRVKTLGRRLPLGSVLAQTIDDYVNHHRSKVPGAKRNPFVFLETEDGNALSKASVYDIFVLLRRRFSHDFPSDFATHILRHTWNDRFKKKAATFGLQGPELTHVKNHIMGWTKLSQQGANYGNREQQEQASKILLSLQGDLLGIPS
jgi:integrase